MLRSLGFLLLTAVLLQACGPNYLYQNEQDLGDGGWSYPDSLVSTFTITDTTAIYNLELTLDHEAQFSFQNVYVRIHTTFPSGERLSEEVSLEISDKLGVPYGKCSGGSCTLQIPIQQGAYFDQAGDYRITIEQFSRENPLPGVSRVAFAIEETGETRGGE